MLTVNGKPATPLQEEVIPAVMHLGKSGHTGNEDEFGQSGKVRVGDKWAFNPMNLAKMTSPPNMPELKVQKLDGTMKLAAVTERDGQSCLGLHGIVKMTAAEGMEMPGLRGIKVAALTISAEVETQLPVDPSAMVPEGALRTTMRTEANGETTTKGRRFRLEMTSETRTDFKWRAKLLP